MKKICHLAREAFKFLKSPHPDSLLFFFHSLSKKKKKRQKEKKKEAAF
jgi:hypothetical protein